MPKGGNGAYVDVPEVVVITLVDGRTIFPGEGYLTVGRLGWERNGGRVPGRGNPLFIVAEMEKVRARYNRLDAGVLADELTSWLYLLASGYRSDEEVERMGAEINGMEDFAREYGLAMDDPDIKRYYDAWYESQLEWNSLVRYELEQHDKEIAENMREMGFTEEQIAQALGAMPS